MKCKTLEKSLSFLELDKNIISTLNNNGINCIQDLWILKRKDLKGLSLTDQQIKEITIKLQLIGLDLNNRKY